MSPSIVVLRVVRCFVRCFVRRDVRWPVALAASSIAAAAFAQSPPKGLEALPDVPPPPTLSATPGAADDEDNPQITIKQGEGGARIEEFRTRGGKLYAVRVTPVVGKPYLLVDPDNGESPTSSGELGNRVRPAQWTLFEF